MRIEGSDRVLINAELAVTARRKATKQFRNHASTGVNSVFLAEMSPGLRHFARNDGPGIVSRQLAKQDILDPIDIDVSFWKSE
jgi:hypothetical protein